MTLDGLSTIRASNAELILMDEFDNHQNVHTSCWFMFISTSAAFGMVLDILCLIFVAFVIFSFLLFESGEVGSTARHPEQIIINFSFQSVRCFGRSGWLSYNTNDECNWIAAMGHQTQR